jgi:hypothetical protein
MVPLHETRHGNVSCWIAVTKRLKKSSNFYDVVELEGKFLDRDYFTEAAILADAASSEFIQQQLLCCSAAHISNIGFSLRVSQNSANQGLSSISLLFRRISVQHLLTM